MKKLKMHLTKLRMTSLSVITGACLLSSCAKLERGNYDVCRDKGPPGARCGCTEVGEAYDLTTEQWNAKRFGQFCLPEAHFAHMQLFVEQACAMVKGCKLKDIQEKAAAFAEKLQVPYYKWEPKKRDHDEGDED